MADNYIWVFASILALALYAITNVIDKILREKYVKFSFIFKSIPQKLTAYPNQTGKTGEVVETITKTPVVRTVGKPSTQ